MTLGSPKLTLRGEAAAAAAAAGAEPSVSAAPPAASGEAVGDVGEAKVRLLLLLLPLGKSEKGILMRSRVDGGKAQHSRL